MPSFPDRTRFFRFGPTPDRHILSLCLLAATIVAAGPTVLSAARLTLNISPCLPLGVYRLKSVPSSSEWKRGMLVEFCPPETNVVIAFARGRGWLGTNSGECPGGVLPLIKQVGALPGDVVDVEPAGIRVNGHMIGNSAVVARSKAGSRIPHQPFGSQKLAPGEFFAVATHSAAAFDSRYFGPVPESLVSARLTPVLTW